MKRILLSSALFFLMSVGASAQEGQMSLKECIQVALGNNLSVKRGVYNVEGYKINFLQSVGAFLPTFTANGNYSRNYGRNLNPVTYTYFQGVTKTINPSLSSQLVLFGGLRNQNTFRQSRRNVEASDLDLEKAKNDVILNVVNSYVTVILNRELMENAKVQLASSEQQLDKIKKQVEAGALPKSNELNQEAIVATNESNLITQENALNLSLLQLKQVMQLPGSTQLDVIVPDIALEDLVLDQTPEEIYKMSTQSLPQVKSALLKVQAADYALKAARGSYSPRLSMSFAATSNYNSASDKARSAPDAGYVQTNSPIGYDPITNQTIYYLQQNQKVISNSYGAGDQIKDNLYKNLGFNLTIPILNGLQTRTNVQQAEINRELANITVKETENTLRQSIETAYNNAVSAVKTYNASLRQVNASEEAFRMTKQRLDNGAANFVEYQISANDLYSAKSALSRAKFTFLFAKKILDFYEGKQIEF